MNRKPRLYQHYTWPEMAEVVKKQPVVVLPIESVEVMDLTCSSCLWFPSV